MKTSLFQSVLKRVVGCETVEENVSQTLFFQRNNVNLSCQIDKDCQKEKESAVKNECMLMYSLITLDDEK